MPKYDFAAPGQPTRRGRPAIRVYHIHHIVHGKRDRRITVKATTFVSLAEARKFAQEWVGCSPRVGLNYAVADYREVRVIGTSLINLFPSGTADEPTTTTEFIGPVEKDRRNGSNKYTFITPGQPTRAGKPAIRVYGRQYSAIEPGRVLTAEARTFRTLARARWFAEQWVGYAPTITDNCAVANNREVKVIGVTLQALFPGHPVPVDYSKPVAAYITSYRAR